MDFNRFSPAILMAVSLLGQISWMFLTTLFSRRKLRGPSDVYLLTMASSFVTTAVMLLYFLTDIKWSVYTLFIGIIFGLFTITATLFSTLAILEGPISLTRILLNLSTLIAAFSGLIFWNESIAPLTYAGLTLLVVSFLLCTAKEKDGKKGTAKWILCILLAITGSAGLGILQKIHQLSDFSDELPFLMLVAFAVSDISAAVMYIRQRKKDQEVQKKKLPTVYFVVTCIVCGVGNSLNYILNTYLCGVIDTAIFFPLVNGIPMLAALLLSFLVFREKLEKKQLLGFIIGMAAMVCLCVSNMI